MTSEELKMEKMRMKAISTLNKKKCTDRRPSCFHIME